MYNPCVVTPVASSSQYSNQLPYQAQPRESQYEHPNAGHILLPMHSLQHGAAFSSQAGHMAGGDFYMSQPFQGSGHENTQPPRQNHGMPFQDVGEQGLAGAVPPVAQGPGGPSMFLQASRDVRGGRGRASLDKEPLNPTSTAHTPSGGGTLHTPHDSIMEDLTPTQRSNNPPLLSTNSSKSSPPYTLSQRKQLRVEEKLYLKEVKKSIAEGRVPQVHLQQNSSGDIVQYKAQFLNALKLAALAIVPDADIDIRDHSTMHEIMTEVRRQFVIDQPLPEGMVTGFLQRLYKRNRAVYHHHWTVHGDESKPDDCSPAAWSQLVDYWKSREGNRECERNKANASAKKCAPVRFSARAFWHANWT